jgi:DNA mismatch endonuclease (patch repair protein)
MEKQRLVPRPATSEARSRNMAAIRSAHTKPELAVRRTAHALGYRFRLHARTLPGRPDVVFSARRKVIFVHGCFWHQHDCRDWSARTMAADYWREKLKRNRHRDQDNRLQLRRLGWAVLVIWECQTHDKTALARRLRTFLA